MEPLFVSCSDQGKVRQKNEDFAGHARNTAIGAELFCVADGMGGHGSGDLASRTVVDSLLHEFKNLTSYEQNLPDEMVNRLFIKTQQALCARKKKNNIKSIIGTTLSALIVFQHAVICANVGDTRIYCFDEKNLIQKNHDHTYVNDLLANNRISKEQAREHPQKNVLTRAITGDETEIEAYVHVDLPDSRNIYLICSDGLYNMVDEDFMYSVLKQSSIFQARDYLLKQAYANGATDNITFQIIKPFDDEKTVSLSSK